MERRLAQGVHEGRFGLVDQFISAHSEEGTLGETLGGKYNGRSHSHETEMHDVPWMAKGNKTKSGRTLGAIKICGPSYMILHLEV